MRIFVTGASGWIGSAVVPELLGAGHEVVGLARSDAAADSLVALGAEVRRGSLDDLGVLRQEASASDGVIHLAFKHDIAFTGDFAGAVDADRLAIEALGDGLAGTDAPLVIASGLLGVAPGRVATEVDGTRTDGELPGGFEGRLGNALRTTVLADRGVRSSVLRLPPTVHGAGDPGFVATLVAVARERGVSGHVGDNRWPAVHRLDAARLFRLAVEGAPARSTLHAVGDEGVPLRRVAEVIGAHLDLPVVAVAPDDAAAHFGWLAGPLSLDTRASAVTTRERLGWEPTGPGLLADLDEGHYFVPADAG